MMETCSREVQQERKDKEGHTRRESYTPRWYRYSYDFYVIIHVNHPYFNEIRLKLNSSSIEIPYNEGGTGRPVANGFSRANSTVLEGNTTPPPLRLRQNNQEYAQYEAIGNEIKEALTSVRTQIREEVAAAAMPKQKVMCPYCGASTIPDLNGCCEFCGGAVNE